jgi:DNA-binding MarR family transcriptional regulator
MSADRATPVGRERSCILIIRMPEYMRSALSGQGTGVVAPANTTALLGRAYMKLGHRIVDGVVSAGFPQRPAHSAVFAHIDVESGTRLSTLAARANITPQAMGELVDDLQRLRYIVRRPDPDDRRAKRIILTERGRACVAAAQRTIAAIEAGLEELLGPDELALVHRALRRIIADDARAETP